MLFNSLRFVLFAAAVIGAYHLVRRWRWQNALLLAASVAFYLTWDYRFLALLAWPTIVDFAISIWMTDAPERRRNLLLTLGLANNLLMLATFKYFNFFADSGAALLRTIGLDVDNTTLHLLLPVGISFYTFHTMSYTIDVWRRRLEPERNFVTFALYVTYFPQLAAGPISRGRQMLPQLNRERHVNKELVYEGLWLIFYGLVKKVVIADNLAVVVNSAFSQNRPESGLTALLAIYAFAFQIYCDFSGYSDMARGLSKLFGLELMLNFDRPYIATNPSDFWRRWHISLSTWLRDYLYIPLGGNQGTERRTFFNLLTVMTLGGLWHGASWTFVVWGVYHGLLLCGHRILANRRPAAENPPLWLTAVKRFGMFQLVCLGWLFFRASGLDQINGFLGAMLRDFAPSAEAASLLFTLALFAGLLIVLEVWTGERDIRAARGWATPIGPAVITGLVLVLLLTAPPGSQQFIYFQF